MLNYLLYLAVFTVLLTPDIKHVLPRAVGLQKENRITGNTTKDKIQSYSLLKVDEITLSSPAVSLNSMRHIGIFQMKALVYPATCFALDE